jgi:hypothetical protein
MSASLFKRRKRGSARQELILAVARPLAIIMAYLSIKALRSIVAPSNFSIGGDLAATLPLTEASWVLLIAPLIGLAAGLLVIRITSNLGGTA